MLSARAGDDLAALERPAEGVVLTPPELARLVAWRLCHHWRAAHGARVPRRALDPAAGTGHLLLALAEALGPAAATTELLGVELQPALAERARAALAHLPRARITTADALLQPEAVAAGGAELVIANPPYLAEKGHAPLFRRLVREPRWRERIRPRGDLQYPFLHLVLDALAPGGLFAAITAAYWPTASGADVLRRDLAGRARLVELVDLGPLRPFPGAPGHHTLLVFGQRADAGAAPPPQVTAWWVAPAPPIPTLTEVRAAMQAERPTEQLRRTAWTMPTAGDAAAAPWHPQQTDARRRALAELDALGRPLGELLADRQGIVSGMDRDAAGQPVFRFEPSEARALRERLGADAIWPLWPLLRGSAVSPFGLVGEPGGAEPSILYLGGDEDEATLGPLLEHLAPHRARLEARREVELGRRPWWALQWPRERARLTGEAKLVCPRRAPGAVFALEHGAHAVSSDCTWLVPVPDASAAPSLRALHLVLNSSAVDFQLQHRGKRKGRLIELYAAPLREVRLPPPTAALEALADATARVEPLGWRDRLATDLAVLAALELPARLQRELESHALARWMPSVAA